MAENKVRDDLARVTREDFDYRQELLKPYEEELRSLVDNNAIVEDAQSRAGNIAERGLGQTDRMLSRYGGKRTGAQARASNRNASLTQARAGTNMINNARDTQETLQFNALGAGVAAGRRRLSNGLNMMGDSAGMAANRSAAYNSAMQGYKQNQWGTISGLAGLAGFGMAMGI